MVTNGQKLLGGFIGLLVGITFFLGWIPFVFFLISRKKYKQLIFPCIFIVIVILTFLIGMNINDKAKELSYKIERNIFTIEYPASEKYSEGFLSDTIASRIQSITGIPYENKTLNAKLDVLTSKFYIIYSEEFKHNDPDSDTFLVPLKKRSSIERELDSFSEKCVLLQHPALDTLNLIARILLAITFAMYAAYTSVMFYRYLFRDNNNVRTPNIRQTSTRRTYPQSTFPQGTNQESPDLEKALRGILNPTAGNDYTPPTTENEYKTVRINDASAEEISSGLGLTSIQSRKIVNERNANGRYENINSFIARSGLSPRICNHIGRYLDFSFEEGQDEKKGRVVEF